MISREEAKEIAEEVVAVCRGNVNAELHEIRKGLEANTLTEDRIKLIVRETTTQAVEDSYQKITDRFLMGVGKKTLIVIGATVVVMWDSFREAFKKAIGI